MDINRTLSPALIHQMIWRGGSYSTSTFSRQTQQSQNARNANIDVLHLLQTLFFFHTLTIFSHIHLNKPQSFQTSASGGFWFLSSLESTLESNFWWGCASLSTKTVLKRHLKLQLKWRFSHTHFCHEEGMSLPLHLGDMLCYNKLSTCDYINPQM